MTRKSTMRVRKSSKRNAPARIRNRTKRRKAGKHHNVKAHRPKGAS